MGWARGKDLNGRDIGYAIEAKCDQPGCETMIDRGLAYKCGGAPGEFNCCEKFFCQKHRTYHENGGESGEGAEICPECYAILEADPDSRENTKKRATISIPLQLPRAMRPGTDANGNTGEP